MFCFNLSRTSQHGCVRGVCSPVRFETLCKREIEIDILSRSCAYVPSTSNHMAQTGVQETSGCGSKNYTEIETKRS